MDIDLNAWARHAHVHPPTEGRELPTDQLGLALYGILAATDYDCWNKGDWPQDGLSVSEAQAYALGHLVECMGLPPPSMLGLLAGGLDWIMEPMRARN